MLIESLRGVGVGREEVQKKEEESAKYNEMLTEVNQTYILKHEHKLCI